MDQTLLGLYKLIAEDSGIDERHVEHIIKYVFHDTRREIANAKGLNVLIHGFVNFQIPKGRIKKAKEIVMDSYNKGKMTNSTMKKAIKRLDDKER